MQLSVGTYRRSIKKYKPVPLIEAWNYDHQPANYPTDLPTNNPPTEQHTNIWVYREVALPIVSWFLCVVRREVTAGQV